MSQKETYSNKENLALLQRLKFRHKYIKHRIFLILLFQNHLSLRAVLLLDSMDWNMPPPP